MKANIVMIGMPASGKSTVGVLLAKKLGKNFLDVDLLLQEKEGMLLQDIINKKGNEYFKDLEARTLEELDLENTVISPGGSAVYYDEAMEHLKEIATVVYLDVPFKEIEKRLGNLESRGIVFPDGMGLKGLFDEREPLYKKWADIMIEVGASNIEETLELLENELHMGLA